MVAVVVAVVVIVVVSLSPSYGSSDMGKRD